MSEQLEFSLNQLCPESKVRTNESSLRFQSRISFSKIVTPNTHQCIQHEGSRPGEYSIFRTDYLTSHSIPAHPSNAINQCFPAFSSHFCDTTGTINTAQHKQQHLVTYRNSHLIEVASYIHGVFVIYWNL